MSQILELGLLQLGLDRIESHHRSLLKSDGILWLTCDALDKPRGRGLATGDDRFLIPDDDERTHASRQPLKGR